MLLVVLLAPFIAFCNGCQFACLAFDVSGRRRRGRRSIVVVGDRRPVMTDKEKKDAGTKLHGKERKREKINKAKGRGGEVRLVSGVGGWRAEEGKRTVQIKRGV